MDGCQQLDVRTWIKENTAKWLTQTRALSQFGCQHTIPTCLGASDAQRFGCDRWLLWSPIRLLEIPLLRADRWIAVPRHTTTPLLRRAYKGPDSAYMAPLLTWLAVHCPSSAQHVAQTKHLQLDAQLDEQLSNTHLFFLSWDGF